MAKKIALLVFIFFCTTIAWMILGATVEFRTNTSDERLTDAVGELWGSPQYQYAPEFTYSYQVETVRYDKENKKNISEKKTITGKLPIIRSDIDVGFSLDYRKKGLLWYSTYVVDFDGTYQVKNDTGREVKLSLFHAFAAPDAEYDNFSFSIDGKEVEKLNWEGGGVGTTVTLPPDGMVTLRVFYTSRGQDEWYYYFGRESVNEVRDFHLTVETDFFDIDFPVGSISPTGKEETETGMMLTWDYTKKISGHNIGIDMPRKLNPGPLVGRITFFAPVSLFFFFFIMFMITTIGEIRIHSMNYFFLACAFFAFHLLFAYLVDHLNVHLSFIISSATSLFLVISYLRLVVGIKFALVQAGLSQLVYLILFSYSFFFKGYTGLIITVASVVTLFILMQMTGKIDWEKKFLVAADDGKGRGSGGAVSKRTG
jgi:hypothetical protein